MVGVYVLYEKFIVRVVETLATWKVTRRKLLCVHIYMFTIFNVVLPKYLFCEAIFVDEFSP